MALGVTSSLVVLLLTWMAAPSLCQMNLNCSFPAMLMLSREGHSPWRFHSPDRTFPLPHQTGQWFVRTHTAFVSHGTGANNYDSLDGYDLECMENVGTEKVLVRRTQMNEKDVFMCVHFVKRSLVVIQVRMSSLSDTADTSLCDDANLKNDDMTLVYYETSSWHDVLDRVPYMSCSLDQGYFIDQWYNTDGTPACTDDVRNALRIEDECDRGSGLQIMGASDNCPSPLEFQDDNSDPLTCIAGWDDDQYKYAVASDDWNNIFFCLRIPKEKGHSFNIHLFLDGICDSSAELSRSTNHRKLTLTKLVVPDLCSNASPHCFSISQHQCTDNLPNHCRESCGVCPKKKPWLQTTLPEKTQGKYFLRTENMLSTEEVVITSRSFQYPGLGDWRFYGKSPCKRQLIGHQRTAEEYFVVSYNTNGCLPRLAGVMVNTFSESVIGVEFSRSAPIVLDKVNGTATWSNDMSNMCDKIKYIGDGARLREQLHMSSYEWSNLVKETHNTRLSPCDLQQNETIVFKLHSGVICHASLYLKPLRDAFDMVVERCRDKNKTATAIPAGHDEKVRYECLATFKENWNTYRITRTLGQTSSIVNETYVCWILDDRRDGYLMPASDCNDLTSRRISNDQKTPLARIAFTTDNTTDGASNVSPSRLHLVVFSVAAVVIFVLAM